MLCEVMLNSSKSKSRTDLDNENDVNQLLDTNEENSSGISSDQEDCIKASCYCEPNYKYYKPRIKFNFRFFKKNRRQKC